MTEFILSLTLALAVVIATGQLVGRAFRWIGQPRVIGEIVAGILLGPSLLGAVAPGVYAFLLPPSIVPAIGTVAEVGVVFFMFLVGLHLDIDGLHQRTGTTLAVAAGGFVTSLAIGGLAAAWFYSLAPTGVAFAPFAIFFAVAMAVTAFPVLARVVGDLELNRSRLGTTALGSAAIADVTAWCLLAVVAGLIQADSSRAPIVVLLAMGFVFAMLVIGKPLAVKVARRTDEGSVVQGVMIVLVALAAAAWFAHAIGVHAVIGAFLAGAIVPHEGRLARVLGHDVGTRVVTLILPAFFAFAGIRTEIGLVQGAQGWLACAALIVLATLGKVGGTFAGSRLAGLRAPEAVALGVLMNTRGLMEIIVLNIGLELGVMSQTLFTMMVIMAIVTSMATTPALRVLISRWPSLRS